MVAALALIFGISAAVGVNFLMANRGVDAANVDTVPVQVAAMDIHRGGMITSDLITTREFPKGMVPPGAITKFEDAIDRAVSIPMVKGEPVLDIKLSPKGAGRGLAALVPKGMRAVTIQTPNVATGVAGFVMPGNRVDILLTVSESGGEDDSTGGGSTTTLIQRVEILAVDQRIDAPADNKVDVKELRSVTLLVTPNQANLLDLGQNKGTLHLALRNLDDDRDAKARPATLFDLRFRQEKPWNERIKGVLETWAKAHRPSWGVTPPPSSSPPPPALPPILVIRTLRGTTQGMSIMRSHVPVTADQIGEFSGN
jgi:pilus assembly protein CpaB